MRSLPSHREGAANSAKAVRQSPHRPADDDRFLRAEPFRNDKAFLAEIPETTIQLSSLNTLQVRSIICSWRGVGLRNSTPCMKPLRFRITPRTTNSLVL